MWKVIWYLDFIACVLVYFLLGKYYQRNMRVSLICISIISILFLLLMFGRRIKNTQKRKRILHTRIRKSMWGLKYIFIAVTIFAFLIPINFTSAREEVGKVQEDDIKQVREELTGYTMANYLTELEKMEEDTWKELSYNERKKLCQLIIDIEANYLGLPKRIDVEFKKLKNDTVGQYSEQEYLIQLDKIHFQECGGGEALRVCLHEAFHCYQWRLVSTYEEMEQSEKELLTFREISEYKKEFENYKDGSTNKEEYRSQKVEEDAELYAQERAKEYERVLKEYWNMIEEGK